MIPRSALFLVPLAIAGCQTTPSQLSLDAGLIAAGVQIVAPVLLAKPGISPTEVATINAAVINVQAAAQAIQTASGADTTVSVRTLVATVRGLAPIAARYLVPGSQEAVAVQAAVALLPIILQAVGVVMAVPSAPVMSPAQARIVLQSVRR